jgi:hypothetical protein
MTDDIGDDDRATCTTVLDHRPLCEDDRDERRDTVNRVPPSPMPVAGPKYHFTVRHRDDLRPLVEPI